MIGGTCLLTVGYCSFKNVQSLTWLPFVVVLTLTFVLFSREQVLSIKSDDDDLTVCWTNGKSQTISWSEVISVKQVTDSSFWFVPWAAPSSTLRIKTNSQVVDLNELFACDKEFVQQMTNHPQLTQRDDELS